MVLQCPPAWPASLDVRTWGAQCAGAEENRGWSGVEIPRPGSVHTAGTELDGAVHVVAVKREYSIQNAGC